MVGSLSMANTGQPNSGGSQFFINVAHNSFLDWFSPGNSRHPVFGQVTSGLEVVKSISKVQTRNDNPVTPIKMTKITISGPRRPRRSGSRRAREGSSTVEL